MMRGFAPWHIEDVRGRLTFKGISVNWGCMMGVLNTKSFSCEQHALRTTLVASSIVGPLLAKALHIVQRIHMT